MLCMDMHKGYWVYELNVCICEGLKQHLMNRLHKLLEDDVNQKDMVKSTDEE